jgi:nucleoid-associated protein YgaU
MAWPLELLALALLGANRSGTRGGEPPWPKPPIPTGHHKDIPPGGWENWIPPGAKRDDETPPDDKKEPVPPPPAATERTYTIKAGDYPSGLAKRATGDAGRWREILPLNPALRVTQGKTPDGRDATYVVPWQPGQRIKVPAAWNV